MKSNELSRVQIVLLGALDGVLIGVALEGMRLLYAWEQYNRELAEATTYNRSIGYLLEPHANSFLPLVSMIILGVSSYLVHKYFVSRPRWLLVMWVGFGTLSVIGAYFMAPIGTAEVRFFGWLLAFTALSSLVYYGWGRRPKSPTLLWPVVGMTAVFGSLVITQAIGLFRLEMSELRDPLAWLICLTLVIGINILFGSLLSLLRRNYFWR